MREFLKCSLCEFQFFDWRVGLDPKRWSKNIEIKYKIDIKLVSEAKGVWG